MAKIEVVRDDEGRLYGLMFACPGCTESDFVRHHQVHCAIPGEVESPHTLNAPHWGFNGDFDNPTFTPSVLASYPLYDEDDRKEIGKYVCHSFVTDGKIQFLGDCSHALKGQTVDLPEVANG